MCCVVLRYVVLCCVLFFSLLSSPFSLLSAVLCCGDLICSVPFRSVLFCSVLFCFVQPSQVKSSQVKSSQVESDQVKFRHVVVWSWSGLVGCGQFPRSAPSRHVTSRHATPRHAAPRRRRVQFSSVQFSDLSALCCNFRHELRCPEHVFMCGRLNLPFEASCLRNFVQFTETTSFSAKTDRKWEAAFKGTTHWARAKFTWAVLLFPFLFWAGVAVCFLL